VVVSPSAVSLYVGATAQLTATVQPTNATLQTVTWSSSDPTVATVSGTGLVTAQNISGTATITVTTVDGGKTSSSVITVSVPGSYTVNVGNCSDGMTYGPNDPCGGGDSWFNSPAAGNVGDDEWMTGRPGCYVQYTFNGIGVGVLARGLNNSSQGYKMTIDGTNIRYGSTPASGGSQVEFASAGGLTDGPHTVRVELSATDGWFQWLTVDAFKIYTNAAVVLVPPTITGGSVTGGGTSFTVSGTGVANQPVVLWKTPSLAPATWTPVVTNTASGAGAFSLVDPAISGQSKAFYKVEQQ